MIVVDGSNVLHCDRGVVDARWLGDRCASFAARAGVEMWLVFDGTRAAEQAGSATQSGGALRVVASGDAEADGVIERLVRQLGAAGARCWVVSSDTALRQTVAASAERLVSSHDFARELLRGKRSSLLSIPTVDPAPDTGTTRLGERMPQEVRDRLEQLRRGLD